MKRTYEHLPLSQCEGLGSHHVAEAINRIITRDVSGLPLAIKRGDQVVNELVLMTGTDEDGTSFHLPKPAIRALTVDYANRLATGSLFQAAYKRVEQDEDWCIVPVTDYFFQNVYDDRARDCLDAMTPFDLVHSIPKHSGQYVRYNGDLMTITAARKLNGASKFINAVKVDAGLENSLSAIVFESGKIAGIVVFPNGSKAALVGAYLAKLAKPAVGTLEKLDERVEKTGATDHNKALVHDAASAVGGFHPLPGFKRPAIGRRFD